MLIYGPLHSPLHSPSSPPPDDRPVAESLASFTTTDGVPIKPAQLTTALSSAITCLPGPIATLTLVIPAAQCRFANHSFPAGLGDPEAHALAAQMATQIAAELGHSGPLAFDWRRISTNEIALCVAPRDLIANHLEAVRAAGLHCTAIAPEDESLQEAPGATRFNLLPWRNEIWLRRGRTRVLWLAAMALLTTLPAAWVAADLATREQALSTQHTQMMEAIKARQAQLPNLPDLAKLRQQLATQQATQRTTREAQEAAVRQQQAWADRLDHLARRRPLEIRYHSLSYDGQGIRLEGQAQTPAALTQLLKALPCPRLMESHRDAKGPLRFALQLPATCTRTP